ncbi:MAG: bifunctional 5,10-methylene-tetrahydrofolate dehydrogenase/5,10-methylene-tetrahydrofolate cyclohydrolase [Nitrososphaerales archaeon]|nr:bifunctional 5,10-methylene-tetrahydrofolate dehydrogenase/5,10-methylene-tetrahydrofolate cyclohydrolase [Nitrososphaerales archaeon]
MTATIMDGRALAASIAERLAAEVSRMKSDGKEPTLATILVGDDPPSKVYLGSKHKAAQRTGITSESHTLPADASEGELTSLIEGLNMDRRVNGILLQLPLPGHFNERKMIERISPEKDVDGLTSTNTGRLFYGQSDLIPCTPRGVMELLHHYNIKIISSTAVIINRSTLVGKPLYHLLLNEDATVTVCHSKSAEVAEATKRADIVITAVGVRPRFILTADMVKEGAVVIDVAMNRVDGKLVGDADFEAVSRKASFITPVPGGVGPMTVIMLMQNTLIAASKQAGLLVSSVVQS